MVGSTVVFYIKNYLNGDTFVTDETVMQTVPFSGDPVFNNPKAKNDIGKAGSFEFEINYKSPYYNAFRQLKTLIRIEFFGVSLFRGRVLTIDKKMAGVRTVHCEGDFAFMMDSHQIGTKEDTRPEIGVLEYLQQIINQHNADMHGDTEKEITLGEVPGLYTNATAEEQRVVIPDDKASQKFGDTSWNTSMDRLEGLLSDFGGYFRTRYDKTTGTTYLDWYDKFYNATLNTQKIEVAKNLIDLSGSTEVENLFTVVVPIGKGKNGDDIFINDYWPIVSANHDQVNYITVPELASIPLYTDAELNADYHKKTDYQNAIDHFGWIWKPVEFENADTPEKLFNYAKDWMKNNYVPEITQWSVSAVDLKIIDSSKQYILCGDIVDLIHPEVSRAYRGLTVISAEYNFFDPKNNKYTIGVPNQEINAAYGTKTKSKGGGGGGGGGISNGGGGGPTEEEIALERLKQWLRDRYWSKTESNEDITLDNPLAYTTYNTDVSEKDKKDALKEFMQSASNLNQTKMTKYSELFAEAVRRGVPIDDLQLLIDFTPSEKEKQTRFKNQAANYMVNTVGLNHQQANVLLNETASQSYFANLVDDEGNWTPYALSQGASIWNDSANLKQQAKDTRTLLNGGKLPDTAIDTVTNALQKYTDLLVGDGINIDNVFDTDKVIDTATGYVEKAVNFLDGKASFTLEEKAKTTGQGTWDQSTLNFMDIFKGNTKEDGGKEFTVESDTANIDGENGKAQFGKDNNDQWRIKLNETITYVDAQGQTQQAAGFVCAEDFNIPSIPSLKTKLLVVDDLVANSATVSELQAITTRVETLEATSITTANMGATAITCASISSERGGCSFYSGNFTSAKIGGKDCYWQSITYVTEVSLSLTGNHKFEDSESGDIITGRLATSALSVTTETKYLMYGSSPS